MSPVTKQYVIERPVIYKRTPKKKKQSATSRDAQAVEFHFSRAVHRTIRAADQGMTTFRKAQKKSAAKQRDGALVDMVPNILKGSAASVREISLVPYELWRAAYTPLARRSTRRTVRFVIRTADQMLDK